ncbi:MAG: hypothetical protein JWO03_2274 [Bacteroidetes bacterium]|nr:hypothetical protein [Bacteroidota bacterium]
MLQIPAYKVLLIDDDADDRMLFFKALTSVDPSIPHEYDENGIFALNTLRSADAVLPDYIFLDFNMHRMGGEEFLALLRMEEKLKHIPVAVLTTSNLTEHKIYSQKFGATYFITKPPLCRELVKAISIVLQNEKEHAPCECLTRF